VSGDFGVVERKAKPAVNLADDPQGWLVDQAKALRGRRHSKLDWGPASGGAGRYGGAAERCPAQ
jgi:hypothetical protein